MNPVGVLISTIGGCRARPGVFHSEWGLIRGRQDKNSDGVIEPESSRNARQTHIRVPYRVCVRTRDDFGRRGAGVKGMSQRYKPYNPDQAYLLPPSVKDVLGEDHLAFFVHRVVEGLDLEGFTRAYGEEGGALYAPELMLKVWMYAYALGVTSARRLEQRIREDLVFRYLAGGAMPDNWALSVFRRRHARGINNVFTQVLELARKLGL